LGLFLAYVGLGLWVFLVSFGLVGVFVWEGCLEFMWVLGGLLGWVGLLSGLVWVFVRFFFFFFLGIGFVVGFAWVGVEAIISCILRVY
jgi:hypothetical protein